MVSSQSVLLVTDISSGGARTILHRLDMYADRPNIVENCEPIHRAWFLHVETRHRVIVIVESALRWLEDEERRRDI